MARIKHTKNELKSQRDALRRYERFLPMLQLKKQLLQSEIQQLDAQLDAQAAEEAQLRSGLESWVALLAEPPPLAGRIALARVVTEPGNVAGVVIPVLRDVHVRREPYSLFDTPPWVDDAVSAADRLIRLRVEREVLAEQRRRLAAELRVTNQRVNLFEKVKIPECRENIRIIRIFLGDEQTAAVARGKLAKRRAA